MCIFLPILYAEDGYGLTFGARLAVPDVAGANSRLWFPLTLGGTKSAGIELDKNVERGSSTGCSSAAPPRDARIRPSVPE